MANLKHAQSFANGLYGFYAIELNFCCVEFFRFGLVLILSCNSGDPDWFLLFPVFQWLLETFFHLY